MEWTCLTVQCASDAVEAVIGMMIEIAGTGPSVENAGERADVSVYVPAGAQAERVQAELGSRLPDIPEFLTGGEALTITTRTVRDEDWATAWKDHYHAFRIGQRFVIKPSWESWPPEDDTAAAREHDIIIELDPQMAFGTGTHATTQLCLAALEDLVRPSRGVLDIGCGSGILALGAAKLGAAPVMAIDNDPIAVETAQANVAANGAADIVVVELADGDLVRMGSQYIVVANITAPAVCRIVPRAAAVLERGGYFIASGFTERSVDEIVETMQSAGLTVVDRRQQEEWRAVLGRADD